MEYKNRASLFIATCEKERGRSRRAKEKRFFVFFLPKKNVFFWVFLFHGGFKGH